MQYNNQLIQLISIELGAFFVFGQKMSGSNYYWKRQEIRMAIVCQCF